ncbi:MAG TPA: LytTR family DNA-binding domain-containing protein [Casimicrobiaceae bacterium]|jgi:DNA-binding LytR/AlgR family response regulator
MPHSARAVIAEDEPLLMAELRDMLAKLWPELAIVATAEDGLQAVRAIDEHHPDVLFLDIKMPGMSGLDVAHYASRLCHVIFVTAYDAHAVAAFEQGAIDYVMKPFSAARLATTISRVRQRLANAPAELDGVIRALARRGAKRPYVRWITASHGKDMRLITVDEIDYVKADDKYAVIVAGNRESLVRRPIKELIEELDPDVFLQIHRGTLVNVNAIGGVTRDLSGKLRVKLKRRPETLAVSAPYMHLFRAK